MTPPRRAEPAAPSLLQDRSGPARPATPPATFEGALHGSAAFEGLNVPVPAALLEAIARRAAELVAEAVPSAPEAWVGVLEAAEYLACPRSRIYALASAGRIPHCKDGSRLLFRRSELDRWLDAGGGRRP